MDFLSPDFLSLLTGSATGFLFKAMAERRAQDQERFKMAMGVAEKETNTPTLPWVVSQSTRVNWFVGSSCFALCLAQSSHHLSSLTATALLPWLSMSPPSTSLGTCSACR